VIFFRAQEVLMKIHSQFYIQGQWCQSATATAIDVINPSTEQVIGRVPQANAADVQRAVMAARQAFDGWSASAPSERAGFLKKIQDGLKSRADELAQTITAEVGMPLKMAMRIQVGSPIAIFGMYARLASEFGFAQALGNSLVIREAVGVVACITPWNYPLHQIAAKVAAALAAGCTVVLKPSELAPLNAFVLAEIIDAAGLPPGVFNLVSGDGAVTGEALVQHPEVDMVSFTGSTQAGKRVAALAAQSVKRVALELGGKSAAILLDDADMALAVRGGLNACFINSGQTCNAQTRLLVPASRHDEIAQLAVDACRGFGPGDPLLADSRMGPLISAAQRDRVRAMIERGVADQAQLLCGGTEPPEALPTGYFVKPTVFGRVDPDSVIAQEEIFGPVLAIIPFQDDDDAVRIANHSRFGLSGAVWSADEARALALARRLRTGQVDINGAPFNPMAPFGGYKQSGNGRELGQFGLEEFLEYKAVQLRSAARAGQVLTLSH
jgi:betaine-aldehyde dehydrogenase